MPLEGRTPRRDHRSEAVQTTGLPGRHRRHPGRRRSACRRCRHCSWRHRASWDRSRRRSLRRRPRPGGTGRWRYRRRCICWRKRSARPDRACSAGLPRPTGQADHALAVTAGLVALAGMAGFATGLPGIGDSIRRCLCGLFLSDHGRCHGSSHGVCGCSCRVLCPSPVGLSETREERGDETGEEGGEGAAPRSGRAQGLDEESKRWGSMASPSLSIRHYRQILSNRSPARQSRHCPRAAVEARRQDRAEAPTSIVELLQ